MDARFLSRRAVIQAHMQAVRAEFIFYAKLGYGFIVWSGEWVRGESLGWSVLAMGGVWEREHVS